jgi:hypothetical protein
MRGGAVPLERPHPIVRVPARYASGAGRGISRACDARGHRDPAVIEPALTVAVGQATTMPPARHSTLGGERGGLGVAGDPSTSRSGARTFAGSPATWRLLSLRGWGETRELGRDRQLYGVDNSAVSARHRPQQGLWAAAETSESASAPRPDGALLRQNHLRWRWAQRGRGCARRATHCREQHGAASGLSTLGSDLGNRGCGHQAEHASRWSSGAAQCAPPTTETYYRHCSPASQASQAVPTRPAAAADPAPGSPASTFLLCRSRTNPCDTDPGCTTINLQTLGPI